MTGLAGVTGLRRDLKRSSILGIMSRNDGQRLPVLAVEGVEVVEGATEFFEPGRFSEAREGLPVSDKGEEAGEVEFGLSVERKERSRAKVITERIDPATMNRIAGFVGPLERFMRT